MASGISVSEAGWPGAHVDPIVGDGVHANAVAQQGAAGFATGRIGAEDGHRIGNQVVQHAQNQLIGKGGFAGSACAGDADHRHLALIRFWAFRFGAQFGQVAIFPGLGLFHGGNQVRHQQFVVGRQAGQIDGGLVGNPWE
jgi:hypothetical protein